MRILREGREEEEMANVNTAGEEAQGQEQEATKTGWKNIEHGTGKRIKKAAGMKGKTWKLRRVRTK